MGNSMHFPLDSGLPEDLIPSVMLPTRFHEPVFVLGTPTKMTRVQRKHQYVLYS